MPKMFRCSPEDGNFQDKDSILKYVIDELDHKYSYYLSILIDEDDCFVGIEILVGQEITEFELVKEEDE